MLETHPFGSFVPPKSKYLLLGSFTGKQSGDWFYGTKRNQFWSILRSVYGEQLTTRQEKERLFSRLDLAISDIIYQCERAKGTNLDNNLIGIVYNTTAIEKIIKENPIQKVFFNSRFVENKFHRLFKGKYDALELITLPSPSPRYAKLTLTEKISRYRELLPALG